MFASFLEKAFFSDQEEVLEEDVLDVEALEVEVLGEEGLLWRPW
jgi:hypothetical protein